MRLDKFTITGYSTALFSTWIFVEELGLLFDAGDGLMSGLLSKSRKIKHAFISHADRDHITGLLQFNQLDARPNFPIIYYPSDCNSFKFLESFSANFDPHVTGSQWKPIQSGAHIPFKDNFHVEAIRNEHIEAPLDKHKSLSFKVFHTKRKLKVTFQKLSGLEIKQLRDTKGNDFLTDEIKTNLISYSGDTPVDDYSKWDGSQILIHEATFLGDDSKIPLHGNKHSHLEEVIKMVSEIKVEKLILNHFSSRYSQATIDKAIKKLSKTYKIDIPIYRILPGKVSVDILNDEPINA